MNTVARTRAPIVVQGCRYHLPVDTRRDGYRSVYNHSRDWREIGNAVRFKGHDVAVAVTPAIGEDELVDVLYGDDVITVRAGDLRPANNGL